MLDGRWVGLWGVGVNTIVLIRCPMSWLVRRGPRQNNSKSSADAGSPQNRIDAKPRVTEDSVKKSID